MDTESFRNLEWYFNEYTSYYEGNIRYTLKKYHSQQVGQLC